MNKVLIIGAGGAGLRSAISAHKNGAEVTVISKSYPTRSQTCMAQGGINAARGENDSVEHHIADTLRSAHGVASQEAIAILCENASTEIEFLDSIGVPFSRDKSGEITQRKLGGASEARACYAQDFSGLKILHTLYDHCNKLGIKFINEHYLINLSVQNKKVFGGNFLDMQTGVTKHIEADAIILATGGYSKIYQKHSTNSAGTTGDGVAVALRAGASISNMEFIQLHPTALKNSSVLISESARGAGGYLVNSKGDRFTNELAPRDEVARAIHNEIESGSDVFLDIRHLGEEFIDENLPQERKLAKLYEGVDPIVDLLPIKPAAHYSMGGIEVNLECETNVKNLFAVGECANHKVHGANRLGGNSLLELMVFGSIAGESAAHSSSVSPEHKTTTQFESDRNFIEGIKHFTNQIDFYEKREFISNIFYNNVGLVRNDAGLKAVLAAIRQIQMEIPFMGPVDKSMHYNTNLVEFIEFGNMVELAEVILVSAISRHESRGAHFRDDIPESKDEMYATDLKVWREEGILCADFVGKTDDN
ncbi:MAG: FAD-dependent oxidoreductase [Helicobacteraceae bacterium]|nr:FAD-dependent oxidoreductase [Helicobacteraceae bacterium]